MNVRGSTLTLQQHKVVILHRQSQKKNQIKKKESKKQEAKTQKYPCPPIALCQLDCQCCRSQAPVSATTAPSSYPHPACASPRSTTSPIVCIDSRAHASSQSQCPAHGGGLPHVHHCCSKEIHHTMTKRPARVVPVAMTSTRHGQLCKGRSDAQHVCQLMQEAVAADCVQHDGM
jgi:hypothetical protein